jgi:hypothetical protein
MTASRPPVRERDGLQVRPAGEGDTAWLWDLRFRREYAFRWLTRDPLTSFDGMSAARRAACRGREFVVDDHTGAPVLWVAASVLDELSGVARLHPAWEPLGDRPPTAFGAGLELVAHQLVQRFDLRLVTVELPACDGQAIASLAMSRAFRRAASVPDVEYFDGARWPLETWVAARDDLYRIQQEDQ